MEFEDFLKTEVKKIEKELNKILQQFLKDTKQTNPKLLPFAKEFEKSCQGGKRIRGVLCILGYKIMGGKSLEIYKIAAAWEILHTAFLIHDDVIDKSPLRRNRPSFYKAFGGNHYGISQSISVGDIGLHLPSNIILNTKFPDKDKLKILQQLSETIISTGWGQVMDVEKGLNNLSSNESIINFINLYKTAKYTIAGPLIMGATLGKADFKLIKSLKILGENLGIAFQIQDDILDKEPIQLPKASSKVIEYVQKAKKIIPVITRDAKMKSLLENFSEYLIQKI